MKNYSGKMENGMWKENFLNEKNARNLLKDEFN